MEALSEVSQITPFGLPDATFIGEAWPLAHSE